MRHNPDRGIMTKFVKCRSVPAHRVVEIVWMTEWDEED